MRRLLHPLRRIPWTCLLASALVVPGVSLAEHNSISADFSAPFSDRFFKPGAAPKKIYTVRRCQQPPKIDGKLDEALWAELPALTLSGGDPKTLVRACFNDRTLFISFECRLKPGQRPSSTPRPRDGEAWKDDSIELCAAGKKDLWYHIIINASNSVYDDRMRRGSVFGTYDPLFQHAVAQLEDRWIAEVALPPPALGLEVWPAQLGFDVGRDGPGLGPRFWTDSRRDVSAAALIFEGVPKPPPEAEAEKKFVGNQPIEGNSLVVRVDRSVARPGERWIEVECRFSPSRVPLKQTRLEVKLFEGIGAAKPIESFSVVPERSRGRIQIDLRRRQLSKAWAVLEFFEGAERTAVSGFRLAAEACARPIRPGERIPVLLDVPAGVVGVVECGVTFGVPFPAGALWDADRVHIVDGAGKPLPHQKEITGRWAPDGSIKWMRFDAFVAAGKGCFVEVADAAASPEPPSAVRVSERNGKVVIDTGAARYVLSRGASPIEEIWRDGRRIAWAGPRGLYVVDQRGRLATSIAHEETMTIESSGPVSSSVKFEGWYATADGHRLARHVTRVENYAGEPAASVTHTFILTEDSNDVWFREIGWEFAVAEGANPRAIFAVDATDPAKRAAVALAGDVASAWMLQDSHYLLGHGQNHFKVVAVPAAGKATVRQEGAECGDYAMLIGAQAGLALACRDAARQHPKEFEVFPDRMVLKLFSNRGGEELDFRTPTLVKKWDLLTWQKMAGGPQRDKDLQKALANYTTNAAGWSKTHLLRVAPLDAATAEQQAERQARLLRTPIYAHVDPKWIYESRAMGPLYPRDTTRFPEAEEMIEAFFRWLQSTVTDWGEYGFVDYGTGPQFYYIYRDGKPWPELQRFGMAYLTRPGIWQLHARSADRGIREYAETMNRTHMDGLMRHHWEGDRGWWALLRWPGNLPFWWQGGHLDFGNTSSINHLIWQYYLTGYRRAGDVVREFAVGLKNNWSPARTLHTTYPPCVMWHLIQCYGVTHDRDLRDLSAACMDLFEDPESALGFDKNIIYLSSTYKQGALVRAYIEGWEIIGETRYHRMAVAFSDLFIRRKIGSSSLEYMAGMPAYGGFRYGETRDPVVAECLLKMVRDATANYDPERRAFLDTEFYCMANTTFMTDIGYALHVVTESNADKSPVGSWLAYNDAGNPTAVFLRKPEEETVTVTYHTPGVCEGPLPCTSVNPPDSYRQDLCRITAELGGLSNRVSSGICGTYTLPKDMREGVYRLSFTGTGDHHHFASRRVPFVFYAPKYWRPLPPQRPAARYYFRLPPESRDAQVFFEGFTRLYDPSGVRFGAPKAHGWVDLPADKPGLWSFEPIDYKIVRTRNVPPFFAVRDPENHFIPDVPWEREALPARVEPPQDGPFGPGAVELPGNKALYLMGRRTIEIQPGPARPDGDGGQFLPFREGTIEFFMRPMWSSVELTDGTTKRFLFAPLNANNRDGSSYLYSDYTVSGTEKTLNFNFQSDYKNSDAEQGRTTARCRRLQTFFDAGEWVHVAYVWGRRNNMRYYPSTYKTGDNVLTGELYINGRLGNSGKAVSGKESHLSGPMIYLSIGLIHGDKLGPLDAAIDELRVSDIQRYRTEFQPPSRNEELRADAHTRLLMHFNGDLRGVSHGTAEQPVVKLRQ